MRRSTPRAGRGSRFRRRSRPRRAGGSASWRSRPTVPSTAPARRAWAWQNVFDLAVNVPAGVASAARLLVRLRPRVVFATGGFVALPVVLAAATLRVPIVIHEQTTVPGLANRIGARFARRIAVTFPDGGGHFPAAKVVVTGNPLRPELRGGSPHDAVERFGLDAALPLVYVTGGRSE